MSTVHLLVLIHGMWGNPGHLAELARIIRENQPKAYLDNFQDVELSVLVAETNRDESTYDGIDWGGERVAQEVMDEVEKIENKGKSVTRFSVTGYSLGGLVARYVIGILHQRKFFESVTPVNFNTFATPHIGLPRYPSMISSIFSSLGPRLLSRTGEQFYCVDKWSAHGRPLLEVMVDPERIFYQALALFPHIRIYANAVNDVTVPYVTSSIELEDPFAGMDSNGIEIELDKEYGPLIASYSIPTVPPTKPPVLSVTWFRSLKAPRPFLPPALQFRFPLNIFLYFLLPILIPVGASFAVLRLYLASRSSRERIKLLEEDESASTKLIHIVAQLEKQMEDAVADLIDEPDPEPSLGFESSTTIVPSKQGKGKKGHVAQQPVLTPLQKKLVVSLNKLPNLKKELAFIHPVRNAHAVIVCRDVKRFALHRAGEGVVRHWADQFIL